MPQMATALGNAAVAAMAVRSTWRTFSHLTGRLLSLDDGYASPDVTFLPLQPGAIVVLGGAYQAFLEAISTFMAAKSEFESAVSAQAGAAMLRGDAAA
jgi:hypothetical protein